MDHHDYQKTLKKIWQWAVEKYEAGNREPDDYFDAATLAELASVGLKPMDVYDFAEDFVTRGEPDFETFLMISEARRDYYFTVQGAKPSEKTLDPESLQPKRIEVNGIVWLPRIMPKALGKLRGELPPDTMYGCGGRQELSQRPRHPPRRVPPRGMGLSGRHRSLGGLGRCS